MIGLLRLSHFQKRWAFGSQQPFHFILLFYFILFFYQILKHPGIVELVFPFILQFPQIRGFGYGCVRSDRRSRRTVFHKPWPFWSRKNALSSIDDRSLCQIDQFCCLLNRFLQLLPSHTSLDGSQNRWHSGGDGYSEKPETHRSPLPPSL